MPPKKQQKANAKTEQKKKDKIIEDKTFGLKNKKGSKQQTYIKSVQQQVKYGNQKASKVREMEEGKFKTKKDAKKKEQDELNQLFRPAQKISKGADPKSVVCAFFKQGSCSKGDKCKFSHDLSKERKAEKKNMYEDTREDELKSDTMDTWDEEKLKEVVDKKHGAADKAKNPKTSTDIVCKHFIHAIEECKYGWFWTCPNGGEKCMYKHALPPGFVLKREKKKMAEQAAEQDAISLEELIEDERAKLSSKNLTKITLQTFNEWKARKIKEKKTKHAADMKKKKDELKQGKSLGVTGRELFSFRPELVDLDDAEADAGISYVREEETEKEEDGAVIDVTIESLAAAAREADNSGTVSSSSKREGETSSAEADQRYGGQRSTDNPAGIDQDGDSNKLDQAAAMPPQELAAAAAAAAEGLVNGIQVDEALFDGEVEVDENLFDAELEGLDEDLENIDLE